MRWLEQAREDLRWTRDLAEGGGYHIACFFSPAGGRESPQVISVRPGRRDRNERLSHQAAEWEPRFTELVKRWAILDGFHVPTRCPSSIPDSIPARVYTQQAAREATELASEIVAPVEGLLNPGESSSPK